MNEKITLKGIIIIAWRAIVEFITRRELKENLRRQHKVSEAYANECNKLRDDEITRFPFSVQPQEGSYAIARFAEEKDALTLLPSYSKGVLLRTDINEKGTISFHQLLP